MSIAPTAGLPLLERVEELQTIADLIDGAVAGAGGNAVVDGEAGIGQTALLDAAAGQAMDRGARVLRARGSELERPYAFGVAVSLLGPIVRDPAVPSARAQ